jgi:hypothetical protein
MSKSITAILPGNNENKKKFIDELRNSNLITEILTVENPFDSSSVEFIKTKTKSDYILIFTQDTFIELGLFSIERFLYEAESTGCGLVYSDYFEITGNDRKQHPTIDYQAGSIRDDFNFGPILFISTKAIRDFNDNINYKYAGLYALRLFISRTSGIKRIPEYLYSMNIIDSRKSGDKLFDYVNPKNREVQIEMEDAATGYLKRIDAYLRPEFKNVTLDEFEFPYEASVIIPVKNRVKTIGDAIKSVLEQVTDFRFNIIIVDNYSTDGTTAIIKDTAAKNENIIHLIPNRKDLGIGGCWNEAVNHQMCGKVSVQLDSDDIYKDSSTLQKIVDTFRKEKCAIVIGSYTLTDFQLNEIPPGIIDHREWTAENGRNNALRINGLGAPRAFYTPVIRKIGFPNVSYGEDYAISLAISRNYKIGRIYESIYYCRRWEENSDAALSVEKQNENNTFKDSLRTIEISERQKMNLKSV